MAKDINSSISLLSHIHSITADFLQKKLAERGLPEFASSHGNILFQLSIRPKMTMSDLAEKINRDKSTTTVLVRKLEREGFVEGIIDSKDKRSRFIKLTDKGQQYNATARDISKELLATFYADFTPDEKEKFFGFLQRIELNFKE